MPNKTHPEGPRFFDGSLISAAATMPTGAFELGGRAVAQSRVQTYTYGPSVLKSAKLPSGRQVTRGQDDLGRAITVSGALGTEARTYIGATTYRASGRIWTLKWAPSVTLEAEIDMAYNGLLQWESAVYKVGSVAKWTGGVTFPPVESNNGNPVGTSVTLGGATRSQSYTYDGVNRLKTATEAGGWTQTYVYDGCGNRALLLGSYARSGTSPLQVASDDPALVRAQFSGNRFLPSVASHDGAGNIERIVGPPLVEMKYDVENRQTQALSGGVTTSYEYDGEGRRVSKKVGSGGKATYVYNAMGELVAEYGVAATEVTGTHWVVADHLGSTRALAGTDGEVKKAFDYLPFGEDLVGTVNGRGALFPANPNLQGVEPVRFTGKERDAETGLDYFLARYYSPAQGRFTSGLVGNPNSSSVC